MKIVDLAETEQTPYGRYSFLVDGVPRLRPYTRDRRFPFTVENVTYSELSQELLPEQGYRRGDGQTQIPTGWDGITFTSRFGLGGSDMETMRDMISVLRTCPVVSVPREHGDVPERLRSLVTDIATKDRTARVDGKPDGECLLITSLDIPQDRSGITVHSDFFDGGVLSKAPLVPSISSDFTVRKSTDLERSTKFSTSPDGSTKWEYAVHVNAGRDSVKSKYVKLPTNTAIRNVYQRYQECYETMVDYVDDLTHTNVA